MLIGGNEFKLLSKIEQENIINSIKHYYFDTILCRDEICELLNIKMTVYKKIIRDNCWKRSKQQDYECQKRIKKIRYGYENPWQDVENIKQSYIKHLSVDNPQKSKRVKEKTKQTKLERYKDENYNNREKYKQTCLERYGFDSPIKCPEVKEKIKQTNLKRYGVENVYQSEEIKEKIKQDNIQKYGCEHSSQRPEVKERIQHTIKNKYNVNSPSQLKYSQETISIIQSPETFRLFLSQFNKNKCTIDFVANRLDIGYSTAGWYVRKFNCEDLVNRKQSSYESVLFNFFKDLNVNVITRNRKIIYPQEIDLFIPEYDFGIEFNGNYYHSYCENDVLDDRRKGDILYHQNKSLKAKEKGIFIYHIFEYEWNDKRKQEIIKSQLRNLCHKNDNKIYARNCEIKEVKDNKLIRSFLDKNHLQGYRSSKIKLGLFYNDELVSLMTFGKPYLSKSNNYEWELYRFCNKLNTSVIGGFNKLLNYFIKVYNPKNILTYSNFAKGSGSIYKNAGFECLELTKPNYVWWKGTNLGDEILARYQTQMKDEVKIMEANDYSRIYDCGNNKWVLNLL